MFKCNKCGNEMEELPTYEERRPYGESYAYETMINDMCPYCHGDMLEVYDNESEEED